MIRSIDRLLRERLVRAPHHPAENRLRRRRASGDAPEPGVAHCGDRRSGPRRPEPAATAGPTVALPAEPDRDPGRRTDGDRRPELPAYRAAGRPAPRVRTAP